MDRHYGNATRDHRLLGPERWFADFILDRQRTHRTPAILRMERNYGPEGIALLAAGILSGFLGGIVGCTGIVFLLLSGDHGTFLATGYCLLAVGALLEAPVYIRAAQGSKAGRRFRGDRPFEKRP